MSSRVLSVTGPASITLKDQAATVMKSGELAGKIPIEDIGVIVLDGPDIQVSHAFLAACAEANALVVVCSERHLPVGSLLPLAGHSIHTEILRLQIDSAKPTLKRTWQSIVRAKISAQANLLDHLGQSGKQVRNLLSFVRSGDPDNIEARAAARYFPLLFGPRFVRTRFAEGINGLLNYGYAVLRAAVARAVVGAGLHPSLGVNHRNRYNALCLADDAMEPLRPLIDNAVYDWARLRPDDELQVNPASKKHLILQLGVSVRLGENRLSLLAGLERYAADLRRAICEGATLCPPVPHFE